MLLLFNSMSYENVSLWRNSLYMNPYDNPIQVNTTAFPICQEKT